jgi:hypothetical protein
MKKKVIRLNEQDIENLVKKIIKEEEVPYWKQQMIDSKKKKEQSRKYPDVGKIVKYDGEYGVVIVGDYGNGKMGSVVRWDTPNEDDTEQYGFFDYEYLGDYNFKHINKDGSLK